MTTAHQNYQDQTKKPSYTGDIDNFSNHEYSNIREQTQSGAENLRNTTIDYNLHTASTRSELAIQQTGLEYNAKIQSVEGYILKTDELLQNIKEIKTGTGKKGLTQAGKRTMDDAKAKLKQYEDNLKGKKKHLLEWQGAEIYDNDISDIQFIENQLSIVKEDIAEGQRGNYSSRAAYLYNSPENAKKSNKRQEKAKEFNTKFTELTRDGAILNIFNRNLEQTRKYLQRIAEGNYTYADYQIYTNNSAILAPRFNRYGIMIPVDPRYNQGNIGESRNNTTNVPGVSVVDASGNTVENNVRTVEVGEQRQSVDYSNMDRGETFQQGGIGGLLDKALCHTNMTPGQKDTWKSLGILGGFAAGIFGLYKFFTNKNRSLWAKAGITAAAIFGTQALTGEGPISLFNKLMTGGLNLSEYTNKFGSTVASIGLSGSNQSSTSSSGTGETIQEVVSSAMYSMMIFNSNTKVKDIDEITQSFKTNNENRTIFYNQSCEKLQKEYGQKAMESFQATFTPQFDEQKWTTRLTSFGITNTTNRNESIYGLANNATMNETILEKFKTENGLKDNGNQELKDYINNKKRNNQPIDIDDLNYHINDWFTPIQNETQEQQTTQQINNQTIEQTNNQNIEIQPHTLKPSVERGLSRIFQYFKSKYGWIVSKIGIKDSSIQEYSPGITQGIITNILKINGNKITLDLSDTNLKPIYDNFIQNLSSNSSFLIRGTVKGYNRNGLSTKLREAKHKGKMDKYNNLKNNFSTVFQTLFSEIIPTLQSQGTEIGISCNGGNFNNIETALNSLQILQ